MELQSALNACLFLRFVYDNWNVPGRNSLDSLPIVDSLGQPIFPDKNFTVLRTLYSNDLATDLHSRSTRIGQWKIIGIVAVNNADPKDAVIAIRGTSTVWEWVQDVKFWAKPFSNVPGSGLTEDGFTDMYQSFSFQASTAPSPFITDLISRLDPGARVFVTGHSLGAALATLLALDLSYHSQQSPTVYTIASPRVGDLFFHKFFTQGISACYRVENRNDKVPWFPPPGVYEHVGEKFELIPPSDLKNTPPCNHHLSTYLHLLGTAIGNPDKYPIQDDCVQGSRLPEINPDDEP